MMAKRHEEGSTPVPADLSALLPSWINVAWTLAILSGVGVFFRERIGKFIDAKAQHRFDTDIETLRNDLSRSASEVESLRANVLSLRAQRQAGVEKRRLEAIDQLWAAVKVWQAKKGTVITMSVIKFENAAKEAETNPKMRQFAEIIAGGKVGTDLLPDSQAHGARPYVSALAWALFNAYESAIVYALLQLTILQNGLGADAMKDPKAITALLVEALPEWKEILEKHATGAFPLALDELEKRILAELRRMIAGEDDDVEHAAQAVRIIARVEELNRAQRKRGAEAALNLEVGG